jgi:hypothetical protein
MIGKSQMRLHYRGSERVLPRGLPSDRGAFWPYHKASEDEKWDRQKSLKIIRILKGQEKK